MKRVALFPASRGLSLLSFLPRRERPLLAGKLLYFECSRPQSSGLDIEGPRVEKRSPDSIGPTIHRAASMHLC